jgi:hypothetical protein
VEDFAVGTVIKPKDLIKIQKVNSSYLAKHAFCEKQITGVPLPDVGLVIVIPCHNEPHLLKTLNALATCTLPKCKVEIIVVINAAENCSDEILKENTFTEVELERWIIKKQKCCAALLLYH